jgi:hypothetical protein
MQLVSRRRFLASLSAIYDATRFSWTWTPWEPGVDFVTRIEEAVGESDVVIALIGKRWIGEREKAPPRIHDPQDFVHLEISAALARDIKVIPILVDGASMPNKDQLPRTLQPLVRRNALELSNTRLRFDLERVSQAVQKALVPQTKTKSVEWRWWSRAWYGILSVVAIVLGTYATRHTFNIGRIVPRA